jgi:hypothetical protein
MSIFSSFPNISYFPFPPFGQELAFVLIVSRIGHRRVIIPRFHLNISNIHRRHIVATQDPINLVAGHSDSMSIVYLDQFGQPMIVNPTPDTPPSWSNAPAPSNDDTLTVAGPGNLTAVLAALAAGTDTVTLNVVVGGATFTAIQPVNISAAPQVLTAVEIHNAVS